MSDARAVRTVDARAVDVAAFATVAAFLAFGLRPQGRTWGVNHWAYWGDFAPWILAGVFVTALLAMRFAARRTKVRGEPPERGPEANPPIETRRGAPRFVPILALGAAFAGLFVAFSANTHFLGDGYQTIDLFARDPPFVKSTAPLLRLILPPLRPLFGADPMVGALRTYQAVSYVSGVLFVVAAAVFARAMFAAGRDRALFLALVATGGPMLLFFGYVENYAPFAAFTGITCMAGVAALEGKLRRGWVLLPAIAAMTAHAFGPILAPAVAWVFLAETRGARRFAEAARAVRWGAFAGVAVLGAVALVLLCERSMTVRLAILPISRTWYTLEGYTLFSPSHLLDLANLAIQLFPGLAVLLAALLVTPPEASLRPAVRTFFAFALGFPWLGVCLLAPAIGMPRDWDLFAFAGQPLAIFAGVALLRETAEETRSRTAAAMIAALGLAVLGPRIAEGVAPEVAAHRAQDHCALDASRSRAARGILTSYFLQTGQLERAEEESRRFEAAFPERDLERRAHDLLAAGDPAGALQLCREALVMNSGSRDANMLLGEALLICGEEEESIEMSLRAWAIGAEPLRCAHNLAFANARLGRFDAAEAWWKKALRAAPDSYEVHLSLAQLYEAQGRREDYLRHLGAAARSPRAAPEVIARARQAGAIAP